MSLGHLRTFLQELAQADSPDRRVFSPSNEWFDKSWIGRSRHLDLWPIKPLEPRHVDNSLTDLGGENAPPDNPVELIVTVLVSVEYLNPTVVWC
jgi:hypothetical protein